MNNWILYFLQEDIWKLILMSNKGTAIKWLCDYLKINIKDAISDNYNNIPMIKAKIGYKIIFIFFINNINF